MDLLVTLWDFNVYLFYFINLNFENPLLNFLMPIITVFGSIYLWLIGFSIMFIWGGVKEKNTALLGIITLLVSMAIVAILKYTIAEPRPFVVLDNVNLLQSVSSYSFPSAHSATAFAGSIILGKKYGYIYPLISFACLVAFSRIYVGVHYPIDIIFGAIIGITCALIFLKFENLVLSNKYIQTYKNKI